MAKQGYVVYTADKIKNRKKRIKRAKIIIGIVFLLLMLTFVVLSLTYNGGAFTVTLDPNFHTKAGMAIYIDDVGRELPRGKEVVDGPHPMTELFHRSHPRHGKRP